jgi:hypothetical protein
VAQKRSQNLELPGLFMVRGNKPKMVPAAEEGLASLAHERLGAARTKPTARQKSGFHRYCSGCAQETEHVAWVRDGRASIPSIRWPAAEPASGTTICLNCGQWRAAASARAADDAISETAAENEGMPPNREPRPARAA